MGFGGSCASPAARAEMRGAAAFRAARRMATRAVTTASAPPRGSDPVVVAVALGRRHPRVGVSYARTRGVEASAASSGEFGAPPRIVSGGGGGKGRGGVVWVPSTAGVGGSARGRAFETTAGAGAGAGAPAPAPQQRRGQQHQQHQPQQQFAQHQQHQPQQQIAQHQQHQPQQQIAQHQQHQPQHQPTAQHQHQQGGTLPRAPQRRQPPPPQQRQQRRSTQNQSGDGDGGGGGGGGAASSSPSGPRVYCDFAVYKSKAACKFGVIKPTFEPVPGTASRQKRRDGGVLLEFAPAVGQRMYDWQNKQSILLSPLELVELTESLAVLGKGVNFFHDPGMGTARQGAVTKSLKAEPMPDGSGGAFLNLSTSSGAKLNVAVSFAEFCLLRNLVQYLVPRLTGFSEVFEASEK